MKETNMNIYFEPCNTKQWNIFEGVPGVGHVEVFLATKNMKIGDYVLHYVGQQDSKYKPGVYAISKIIKSPYICRNRPKDYCNNKLSMDVEILAINYKKPYFDYYEVKSFNKQYRTVHQLYLDEKVLNRIEDIIKK